MSITLITGVPGTGKSVYVVWNILRPAVEEGRCIYTAGIPELELPTISKSYKQIRTWHAREQIEVENEYDKDLPDDEIPTRLLNFQEGSLVIVDEVQFCWPADGSREPSEDISYLTKHRHHGLEFVLMTQAPQLLHPKVLAVVDKHLHIRKAWIGRHIYEWPEYCSTTRAKSSRMDAVKRSYKVPKQAFGLYRSATMHVKQTMSVPFFAYIVPIIFLAVFYFGYQSYTSIMARVKPEKKAEKTELVEKTENSSPSNILPVSNPQPVQTTPIVTQPKPVTHTVVSDQVDWSKVIGCISNKTKCVCYGHSAETLVIPVETCRIAVKHGYPRVNKSTNL